MHDSQSNTKIPFMKSDRYLIIFLIIALLLVNAILNLLFGQSYCYATKFTVPYVETQHAASLRIYNIPGREVQILFNEKITETEHEIEFNAGNLSSGIYFYVLSVNNRIIDEKKMVLLK